MCNNSIRRQLAFLKDAKDVVDMPGNYPLISLAEKLCFTFVHFSIIFITNLKQGETLK